jgi:hypothetical protein
LYLPVPSHRQARGRAQDRLLLYLDLQGNISITTTEYTNILQGLTRLFYDTPGSTTYALRTTADDLNRQLLAMNLHQKEPGNQIVGMFTQVVFREDQILLALSGPVKAFSISENGTQAYFEPELSGQGLGLVQEPSIWFTQLPMKPGNALLIGARPSANWREDGLKFFGLGPESMRRRLFDRSEPELNALLIHMRPGKGVIQVVTSQPARPQAAVRPVDDQQTATPAKKQEIPPPSSPAQALSESSLPVSTEQANFESGRPKDEVSGVEEKQVEPQGTLENDRPVRSTNSFLVMIVTLGNALGNFFSSLGTYLGRFFGKLFPDELFEISNTAMGIVAIAIPIIVVTAASVVYFQLGRADQGRMFYIQSGEAAVQALEQTDTILRREGLVDALELLKQAETFGGVSSTQISELRSGIYQNLDQIDQIQRVDYQNALLDTLDLSTRITRMVNSFDNLYMLDASSGRILRALETAQGYQLDRDFRCGPEFSAGTSGPLVGLVLWPESYEPDADVVGMDATGTLLFCKSGFDPLVSKLPPPSIGGFTRLTAIVMDQGKLYVLDPQGNSVWVYPTPSEKQLGEPYLFFDEQIPNLQDAIDIAVNFDELYLLYADGHLALCFADVPGISQAQCADPQPLRDFRQGRENAIYEPDRPFSQLFSNPSPDPSIYMLEPVNQTVTHFSFRKLGFLQEYSPSIPFNENATAFTIRGVDRLIFLALGNQIYYGIMP